MQLIELIRTERSDPPSGIRTLGLDQTHKWITHLERGCIELLWDVNAAYLNLENAVISSWTVALADQALFFASNSVCEEGEGTHLADLQLKTLINMTSGPVRILAQVLERAGDRIFATCEFRLDDDRLAAFVSATIDVIRQG